jgi:hypothetical protein
MLTRLFGDARPIDILILIVDFLVLGVIVFEYVGGRYHKRKMNSYVSGLLPFQKRGQDLLRNAIDPIRRPDQLNPYVNSLEGWSAETEHFLAERSQAAHFAFIHVVDSHLADRTYYTASGSFYASGEYGDALGRLRIKLSNLQRICPSHTEIASDNPCYRHLSESQSGNGV